MNEATGKFLFSLDHTCESFLSVLSCAFFSVVQYMYEYICSVCNVHYAFMQFNRYHPSLLDK